MEDKTPLYMVLIVAFVAIVGLVAILIHGPANAPAPASNAQAASSDSLTGNAVLDTTSTPALNTFGKFFFSAFLVGIAAYMYFRKDE